MAVSEPLDLVVKQALVLTGDESRTVIESGGVAIRGDRIMHVGSDAELEALDPPRQTIDARGKLLAPGLINLHCHAGDSLFRGLIEDLPLEPWLELLWRAESTILTPQTTRLGTLLGLGECLLGGVTTVLDMFWYGESAAAAASELGIRIAGGTIFFDGPGMDDRPAASREDHFRRFIDTFCSTGERDGEGDDEPNPSVLPVLLPHGVYTVSPEGLETVRKLQEEFDCLVSIHAAETRGEQAQCEERYGARVVEHLERAGLLGSHCVLAHCVHLAEAEIELLATSGATVAHNPVSNLKLASGVAPVSKLRDAGVRLGLGTDGPVSGNDLDMLLALRLATILHRGTSEDPTAVTVDEAVDMVTRNAAAALGLDKLVGSLEPRKSADFVLLDLDQAHAVPLFDAASHLALAASRRDVTDVWVRGERVVADGSLTRIDLDDVTAEVRRLVPAIRASIS